MSRGTTTEGRGSGGAGGPGPPAGSSVIVVSLAVILTKITRGTRARRRTGASSAPAPRQETLSTTVSSTVASNPSPASWRYATSSARPCSRGWRSQTSCNVTWGTVLKGAPDLPLQPRPVDHHLGEEGGGVQLGVPRLDLDVRDERLGGRPVEGPFHRQPDVGRGPRLVHERSGRRGVAERQGVGLDPVQEVHDAAVLEPRAVVEEPPELLREQGDGALGVLARFQPVVVHAPGPGVRVHVRDGGQLQHSFEESRQLLLPGPRQEELPERAKASPLIGIRDGVALGHDVFEERSPGALPERDALAHPAIERPEVLLDLAKVGEKLSCHLHELLEAILERGIVQQREVAGPHALDLGVDRVPSPMKLRDPRLRVGLGALAHLPEELEQGEETGLGADEAPFR